MSNFNFNEDFTLHDEALEPSSDKWKEHSTKDRKVYLQPSQSKSVSKPIEEEINHLEKVHKGTENIDDFYQKIIGKKWSVLQKLTHRSMYEKVQTIKAEMFQISAKHRMTIYDLLLQTRIQQTKEKCDSGLKCLKAHYRKNVASYIMTQMEELAQEVKGHQYRFMEMMKTKHEYARTLSDIPSLHKKYMQTVFLEESRHLRFLEQLIEKFENTINEELSLYSQ